MKLSAKLVIWAMLLGLFALTPLQASAAPRRTFPETNHAVSDDFLAFFDSHGGLDIFGYPVTDEIVEGGRTVQYFQRARMELWPENPWPYRVQLGLLGVALGKGQPGLEVQPASLPADARYFPETRHTLAPPFKNFWERHGGLDVFGYPISEQITESGLTVQYFQRARLEWHPENPAPYQIQLGLLGDAYIAANGIKPDAGSAEATSPPTASVSNAAANSTSASAATNSAGTIVFQTASGGAIQLTNANGGAPTVIGTGIDPAWSPDGTRVAYAQWDYPAGIYVMNEDGSEKGLLYAAQGARAPAWSPDGSKIAFVQPFKGWFTRRVGRGTDTVPQDYWGIKVLNLADGKVTDLPFLDSAQQSPQPQSFSPSWAPDSKQVVFHGVGGLYITSDGGDVELIPNTDTRFASPAWSPDGQLIAFTYKEHDHWEIGVISPRGAGFKLLTSSPPFTTPANNVAPAWSPDGSKIAFVSDRDGSWKLYLMDADGRNQRKLGDTRVSYEWANERVLSWTK